MDLQSQLRAAANTIFVDPRPVYAYEKRLKDALEDGTGMKVLALNVRRATKTDTQDIPVLMRINLGLRRRCLYVFFRFECPCGETLTAWERLSDGWKANIEQYEEFMKKRMLQHLKDDGLL